MRDERPEPHGISGWLLFFILTLTVLGPPWKAWRTHTKWEAARNSAPEYADGAEFALLQNIAWTTYAIAMTLGVLAGLLLWKRRRAISVKIAIVTLWLMGPVMSIIGHLVALELIGVGLVLGDLKFLIAPTLSATLWTAYLLKSRRVRNTFGFNGFFGKELPRETKARSAPGNYA